ncbi:cupin [Paludisphaera mucosa]|uniref:cupin n=1 Tax=Paludisphaera mucosa TaxID=3030827 RepID=UPI003F61A6E3
MDRRAFAALLAGGGLLNAASRAAEGEEFVRIIRLEPGEGIPNNPKLPVLLYRGFLKADANDPAAHEALFERNGWPPMWRNGVYAFHHYHATAHEVLGFAGGRATLLLGGPGGQKVDVEAGDVVLLPAGTGHMRLDASRGFLVVGAYPPDQSPDLQREAATPEMLKTIESVAVPKIDPVLGEEGAVYDREWLGRRPSGETR